MKNAEKKWAAMIKKKMLFITMMTNDMPETMTDKQRYHKRNKEKKEKSKKYYQDKVKLQKINQDRYGGLYEEEKIKKESKENVDSQICLKKKQTKNKIIQKRIQ